MSASVSNRKRASALYRHQGGSGFVQSLILVAAVALAALGAMKGLSSRLSEKIDCTGLGIAALAPVPCNQDGAGGEPAPAVPPRAPPAPPPPPPAPPPAPAEEPGSDPVGEFLTGFFAGDFVECESVVCAGGQFISGFVPILGDARDLVAGGAQCLAGEGCAGLLEAGVGLVPVIGDLAKGGKRVGDVLEQTDEVADEVVDGAGPARRTPDEKEAPPKLDLSTPPDEAFFFSGTTDGIGGAARAAEIAHSRGGKTLEDVLRERGIPVPTTPEGFIELSRQFAEQASGEVRVVLGDTRRPDSIFDNVELPALRSNPNVTRITVIDPATGQESVLFVR